MTCDLHIHSCYSFDGHASIADIAHAAKMHGVDIIAITDHCDMLDGPEGYSSYLSKEQERIHTFEELPSKENGPEVLLGIEIGNAQDYPNRTRQFLASRHFDFIIGAIHFLPDGSDIYKLPYPSPEEIDNMFRLHYISMKKLVDMGGFDTLAHLDYPVRVLKGKVSTTSIAQYRELVEPILKGLVEKNIALEVNTRGTYDWQNRVGPEDWVLARYRELGGKYLTIGSDAHTIAHVGRGFQEAIRALKRNGFDSYTIFRNRQPIQIPIDQQIAPLYKQ